MATAPKCFQAKAGQLNPQWYVIDATGQVVGRLAAQIAPILMGKHRPTYTPHIDTGDFVIVTNVDKVVFSGKKWDQKTYQRYTGYPGGQWDETARHLFVRKPERILELAIQRMLPKSKLGRHMMSKLKLCVGPQHPHQAQRPIPLNPITDRPTPAGAIFAAPPSPPKPKARPAKRTEPAADELTPPEPVAPPVEEPRPMVAEAPSAELTPPETVAPPAEEPGPTVPEAPGAESAPPAE